MFHIAVELADFLRDGERPPSPFGQADAVFAGDGSPPQAITLAKSRRDPAWERRRRRVQHNPPSHSCGYRRSPASPSRQSGACYRLKPGGESEHVLEPLRGTSDVLGSISSTRYPGRAQRELAPDFPDLLALAEVQGRGRRTAGGAADHQAFDLADFGGDGFFLAVEFDDQVRAAAAEPVAAGAAARGGERETRPPPRARRAESRL